MANGTGVHDKVVSLDPVARQVTLVLTKGLYHGKVIHYISTDASEAGLAAIEGGTLALPMNAAPGLASNADDSARAAIVPIVNGPTGVGNLERQGLQSALMGEGSPLNITEIHPRNQGNITKYSPLWDVHPAVWSDLAISTGERVRLDHHKDVADLVATGLIVSGAAGPGNPELLGLQAAGAIVNCPVMALE